MSGEKPAVFIPGRQPLNAPRDHGPSAWIIVNFFTIFRREGHCCVGKGGIGGQI